MTQLDERVALVTGASRGVGRGVALGLNEAGCTVYASGRTVADADLPPEVILAPCDHTDAAAVERLFTRIDAERGRLDVLVNSAWGGYERMVEVGRFTWPAPLWEQPRWRWDAMMTAGVRAALVAGQLAARRMVPARRGLIVNLSLLGGPEVHRERAVRGGKGGDRQADSRHGTRAAAPRRCRGLAVPGARTDRGGARGWGLRPEQLREPTVHRARSGRLGRGPGSAALEWAGGRCGRVGPGVRVHRPRRPPASPAHAGRCLILAPKLLRTRGRAGSRHVYERRPQA
jgi:NAD(P)-dependent dehydrogenase (short-subunit alcohol dehydrogenase family)